MIFEINEKSMQMYLEWEKEHDKICPYLKTGSAGGRTTFEFTPTGLGIQIMVRCACGKVHDITDTTEW
jgi:hypothetical protein